MPGHWEWLIILLIVLLLFGAKKLPDLARSLGKGIKEFKKATQDIQKDVDQTINDEDSAKDKDFKDL